ncbi:MAG: SRPBCC family protein [Bacteriovorax sp.]
MSQTSFDFNISRQHNLKLEEYPTVEVIRTFHAPVEQIWKAWANEELIKQWWGAEGYTVQSIKIDFRENGKFLFGMQGPDGKVIWDTGVYLEIIPNKKIINSDRFCDKEGSPISPDQVGMPGNWPDELYVIIEFEALNIDQTKMVIRHEGIPKEMHDKCAEGWNSSIDKLQKLIERKVEH